jgi:tetratricopeptide (TPR) repeat protein
MEVSMLTRHQNPAATPRTCIVLLLTTSLCVPAISAQGSGPHLDRASYSIPSSIHSVLDLAQDLPTHSGVQPQLQTVSATSYNMSSLSPETQGDLLMVRQKYLAAIDAYRQAPHDSAIVWNKLGIAYQHMYALDFAKLQYEKALSLNPHYAEAINNLGTVFYGQKNYHKAESYYRKALRYKPQTASFYSNLGTAYFAEHKYKQGVAAYQSAFSLDPEIFIRESLERISELGPVEEQAKLNYALAKIYAQAGNMKAALEYLRTALSEGFDDRKRLMADKELASLRETPEFHLLLAEQHFN